MPAHPTLKSLLRHLNGYDAIPYYTSNLVAGGGFEPPKLSRQIYSLIPLAARESRLHIVPFKSCRTLLLPIKANKISKFTQNWSWREESNPRPADYKSAALPTELRQRLNNGARF